MSKLLQSHLVQLLRPLVLCAVAACGLPAYAVLGEAVSIADQAPAASQLGVLRRAQAVTDAAQKSYAVAQAEFETGTVLHEFSLPNGIVFAVSWTGPVLPDLKQVLGSHFGAFTVETTRLRAQGQRGGSVSVESNHLVVRSVGRMGAFKGNAYLKNLVPAGTDINELLK